jgi:hypothetical protein
MRNGTLTKKEYARRNAAALALAERVGAFVLKHGGWPDERPILGNEWRIATKAGMLRVSCHVGTERVRLNGAPDRYCSEYLTVFMRFDDVDAAKRILAPDYGPYDLNPYSGKWNYGPHRASVDEVFDGWRRRMAWVLP